MTKVALEPLTFGDKVSDFVSSIVGSWSFIIIQTIIMIFWISVNIYGFLNRWDPYPFMLLNLGLSFQAAYTAPIIMMSQNRMEDKDRQRAILDYETDVKAEHEIQRLRGEVKELHAKIDLLLEKQR